MTQHQRKPTESRGTAPERAGVHWQRVLLVLVGLLLPAWLNAQDLDAASTFLAQSQNAVGAWGTTEATAVRDTTVVLDALATVGERGNVYTRGITSLHNTPSPHTDALARQVATLHGSGRRVRRLVDQLFVVQENPITVDILPNFPAGGWGIDAGFATDSLDTALALRALKTGGFNGGLNVVNETVAVGEASTTHTFELPSGAQALRFTIQAVSGAIRFLVTLPDGNTLFSDRDPSNVPVRLSIPSEPPGAYRITIENRAATPISYSMEVQYTQADGFSVARLTTPVTYLGLAQNPDGGWGIARGEPSDLMVTVEVLRTLQLFGTDLFPPSILDRGVAWLTLHQNADGGFSVTPDTSNVYDTALSILAIGLSMPNTPALTTATAFLVGQQQANGSWDNAALQTALAIHALQVTRPEMARATNQIGGWE